MPIELGASGSRLVSGAELSISKRASKRGFESDLNRVSCVTAEFSGEARLCQSRPKSYGKVDMRGVPVGAMDLEILRFSFLIF